MNNLDLVLLTAGCTLAAVILFFVLLLLYTIYKFHTWIQIFSQQYCETASITFTEEEHSLLTSDVTDTDDIGSYRPPLATALYKITKLVQLLCCPNNRRLRTLDPWLPGFVVYRHFRRKHKNICGRFWWWLCCCGCFCFRSCRCKTTENNDRCPRHAQVSERYGTAMWNSSSKTLIIAFRSTASLSHWETDFRFHQVIPHAMAGMTNDMKVHGGMYKVFETAIPTIRDMMYTLQPHRVFITGHSMGGAVGHQVATDLSFLLDLECMSKRFRSHQPVITHYSFGQPRVGNIEYALHADSLPKLHAIRIFNTEDIIANLPPPNIYIPCLFEAHYTHTERGMVAFTRSCGTATFNHTVAYSEFIDDDHGIHQPPVMVF